MNIHSLSGPVMNRLKSEIGSLLLYTQYRSLFVHLQLGNGDNWYLFRLTLDSKGYDPVSELYATIAGVLDGQVILNIRVKSQIPHSYPDGWRQQWRSTPFLIEASANALLPILELNINPSVVTTDVHTT